MSVMIKLCCDKVKRVSKTTTKLNSTQECDELDASDLLFKLHRCLQSKLGFKTTFRTHLLLIECRFTSNSRKKTQTNSQNSPSSNRTSSSSCLVQNSQSILVRCDNSNWKPLPSSELLKEVDSNRALADWPTTGWSQSSLSLWEADAFCCVKMRSSVFRGSWPFESCVTPDVFRKERLCDTKSVCGYFWI